MSDDVTWHPIETAPKDGTKVMVVSVKEGVWYMPDTAWWDDKSQRFENGEDYVSWDLTYWKPIPSTQEASQ